VAASDILAQAKLALAAAQEGTPATGSVWKQLDAAVSTRATPTNVTDALTTLQTLISTTGVKVLSLAPAALASISAATVVINVTPGFVGPVSAGNVATGAWEAFQHSAFYVTFALLDSEGDPIDVHSTGMTMTFFDPNSPQTILFSATTGGTSGIITVGGTDNNSVTVSLAATLLANAGHLAWILRRTSDSLPLCEPGTLRIKYCPPITTP
jgi:hypothetical protein